MIFADLPDYVEHFRERVLRDAYLEASAAYWIRRAEAFESALPRPGDFTGRATPDELDERRRQVAAKAQACRNKARVMLGGDL